MVDLGDHKPPAGTTNALVFCAIVAHWNHMSIAASPLDFLVWAKGFYIHEKNTSSRIHTMHHYIRKTIQTIREKSGTGRQHCKGFSRSSKASICLV
jgi:hypothetical protein